MTDHPKIALKALIQRTITPSEEDPETLTILGSDYDHDEIEALVECWARLSDDDMSPWPEPLTAIGDDERGITIVGLKRRV